MPSPGEQPDRPLHPYVTAGEGRTNREDIALRIIDTALAAPEKAAQHVRDRLSSRARYAGSEPWSEDGEDWDDDEDSYVVLAARTAAVLRLALEELRKF
ncbi:hypothetical protein OG741_02040 [Streptomyces sp. NBC_01410]|uniref:hypothetical protein n=1 Tax=Streptomyces sp. NBC_01410 TaxID=2903856 RepID=UPI0032518E5C